MGHKIYRINIIISNAGAVSCEKYFTKLNLFLLTSTLQVGTIKIVVFNPRKHSIIIYNIRLLCMLRIIEFTT